MNTTAIIFIVGFTLIVIATIFVIKSGSQKTDTNADVLRSFMNLISSQQYIDSVWSACLKNKATPYFYYCTITYVSLKAAKLGNPFGQALSSYLQYNISMDSTKDIMKWVEGDSKYQFGSFGFNQPVGNIIPCAQSLFTNYLSSNFGFKPNGFDTGFKAYFLHVSSLIGKDFAKKYPNEAKRIKDSIFQK